MTRSIRQYWVLQVETSFKEYYNHFRRISQKTAFELYDKKQFKHKKFFFSQRTAQSQLWFEIKTSEEDKADYEQQRKEILTRELQLLKNSQSRLSIKNNAFLVFENKLLDIASNEKIVSGSIEQSIDELMRIEIIKKIPAENDENEFDEIVNIKSVMED